MANTLVNMSQDELETLIQKIVTDKLAEWIPIAQAHSLTDEEWESFLDVIPSIPSTRPTVLLQQERDQWYKPTS
jgi:hypothetical protein